MFEWFFAPYARLLQGVGALLVVPGTCGAPVDVLRALTLLLCAAAGARIGAHWVADRRLRHRSPVYGANEFSGLYDLYREAGTRVGLKLLQVATLYALFRMEQRLGFAHAGLVVAAVVAALWTFRSVAWPRVVFRREVSCDDRVVEALQNPLVVAASLVQVWRLQRALPRRRGARWVHAHPLLRTRPTVEERVRRLVDYRPDPRRAWRTAARRALAAAALLWTSAFLWSYHGSDERVQLRETAPEFARTYSPARR
jgi:hypothetical protein